MIVVNSYTYSRASCASAAVKGLHRFFKVSKCHPFCTLIFFEVQNHARIAIDVSYRSRMSMRTLVVVKRVSKTMKNASWDFRSFSCFARRARENAIFRILLLVSTGRLYSIFSHAGEPRQNNEKQTPTTRTSQILQTQNSKITA